MFEQSCMTKIVKQNANRLLRSVSLAECSVASRQHWEKGRREVVVDDSIALQNLMPEPETQLNKVPEHAVQQVKKLNIQAEFCMNKGSNVT